MENFMFLPTIGQEAGTNAHSRTLMSALKIHDMVSDYIAVPVDGEEFERVAKDHPLPLPVRFLMGFPPPREILRLDSRVK